MRHLAALFMLLTLMVNVKAYEYLYTNHVVYWGWDDVAYIDSAALLIEPDGLFANCELILDYSEHGVCQDSADSLEIVMQFNLPEGSQVTGLYLWIEDEPVEGRMYDRWTANMIYESIVQRRIDPAILTKYGQNEYHIKIFPMVPDMPRRIKINYMTPVSNQLSDPLMVQTPLNILKLSYETPNKFKIAFKGGDAYSDPKLLELDSASFTTTNDADFGLCQTVEVQDISQLSSLSVAFTNPVSSPVQMHTYHNESTGDDYFELMLRHADLFENSQYRKAVYLVDFLDDNSNAYTKADVLASLEQSIRNSFCAKDSFNLLISGMNSFYSSEKWIGATPENISNVFDSISTNQINDYSNLPTLLVDGIEFVKQQSHQGGVVLISSSNSYGSLSEANALLTDYLESLNGTEIPIHVIDLDDQYNVSHYIGGQYFRGNEYLYTRLTQLTVGEYYSVRSKAYPTMLELVNHRISGYFQGVEVSLLADAGYAYARYTLSGSEGLMYNDQVFSMVGQYIGDPPFYLSVHGLDQNDSVHRALDTLYAEDILPGTETIQKAWYAERINDLSQLTPNNQVMNDIISISIDQSILTQYTALLVLEPDFVIPEEFEDQLDIDEEWRSPGTSAKVENIKGEGLANNIEIYPNPTSGLSTFDFTIEQTGTIQLQVYNATGQLITVLLDEFKLAGNHSLQFDTSDLEMGIYQCILIIDGKVTERVKLVVM